MKEKLENISNFKTVNYKIIAISCRKIIERCSERYFEKTRKGIFDLIKKESNIDSDIAIRSNSLDDETKNKLQLGMMKICGKTLLAYLGFMMTRGAILTFPHELGHLLVLKLLLMHKTENAKAKFDFLKEIQRGNVEKIIKAFFGHDTDKDGAAGYVSYHFSNGIKGLSSMEDIALSAAGTASEIIASSMLHTLKVHPRIDPYVRVTAVLQIIDSFVYVYEMLNARLGEDKETDESHDWKSVAIDMNELYGWNQTTSFVVSILGLSILWWFSDNFLPLLFTPNNKDETLLRTTLEEKLPFYITATLAALSATDLLDEKYPLFASYVSQALKIYNPISPQNKIHSKVYGTLSLATILLSQFLPIKNEELVVIILALQLSDGITTRIMQQTNRQSNVDHEEIGQAQQIAPNQELIQAQEVKQDQEVKVGNSMNLSDIEAQL